ncbi:MAG TPA: VWA domain-containing protein [Pyrinomonadaceae bacterium]|nr:VWA domain-containing protein [Pyrinomonadaceae bacterium]
MKHFIFTVFLTLLFVLSVFAQKPTPTPPNNDENDVVKVSTSLVQLDAVVVDKKGNPVTDLSPEDFEILQDGKVQKITNFSYIRRMLDSASTEQTLAAKQEKKSQIPPVAFRPKEAGRIIAFVVDDGNAQATIGGIIAARQALEKFVNEQMLPNDLVAIYQTRAGSSLLQQYTSDKGQLLQIIKKIRWLPPLGIAPNPKGTGDQKDLGGELKVNGQPTESEKDKENRERLMDFTMEKQSFGVHGTLRYVIKGMFPMSGRKIVFFFSDSLINKTSDSDTLIKDTASLANRASVVINSIEVRGVTNPTIIDASTDVEGVARSGGQNITNTFVGNVLSEAARQSGLSLLANETGGKFYQSVNFLHVPIEKALKLEKGYYLLAYEPEEETFKGKNFHTIQIKLKRDDLDIRSRSGFYGITDEEIRPKPRTEDSELYYSLTTPVPNADLNIKLSSYFANTPNKGNFIRALLYIDGKDITFLDEPGTTKKVVFDMVAVTLNEKNEVIDDTNRTATVHIPLDRVEDVRRDGLIYSVDVPVKKDGTYTFRTALRDKAAHRLGSSSQIIEVPNLSKSKLLISGLMISGIDSKGNLLPTESGESAFSSVVSQSIAAIRKFKRNSVVAYTYTLYNAKPEAANLPKLTVQTNLYYDGKIYAEGQPQPADIGKQADLNRINDFGYLKLNAEIPTGDYVLQVIIKDLTTNQTTSQWIDFEVVE